MYNVQERIREDLSQVIRKAFEVAFERNQVPRCDPSNIPIEPSRDPSHGDFATTVAMQAAREAGIPPRRIAEALVSSLPDRGRYIERVEVAGPGFINFFLTERWLAETLEVIADAQDDYGKSNMGKGKSIQVEFVSANPTGPMNVVNARAGAYGDVLCNILENVGYNVTREYYINDAGRQVELLGKSLEIRYRQLQGEDVELPEECYQGDYLIDLAQEAASLYGQALLSMSPEERSAFFRDFACRRIVEKQRDSLSRFGVNFDVWFSEKTLVEEEADKGTLEALREKGMLYESDGAIWFRSTDFGDDKDRVVVKSDGSFTYLLRDLAYHRNKFDRGFEKVIDIWGPDHHGYVARTKAGVAALGYPPDALEVILLQLVTLYSGGQQVRMSKRKGEFITLEDVVDEVGRDAARYFFIMRNAQSHLDFDLELAKRQSQENPVYYIQYAHARIASILREARQAGVSVPSAREIKIEALEEEIERGIIKKLAGFPDEVIRAALERAPNRLASYGLDLAGMFHSFYNSCRVLGEDPQVTAARLVLACSTRVVLRNLLGILGISAPERM